MTLSAWSAFTCAAAHSYLRCRAKRKPRGFQCVSVLVFLLFVVSGFDWFVLYPLFSRAVSVFTYTARNAENTDFEKTDATITGGNPNEQ